VRRVDVTALGHRPPIGLIDPVVIKLALFGNHQLRPNAMLADIVFTRAPCPRLRNAAKSPPRFRHSVYESAASDPQESAVRISPPCGVGPDHALGEARAGLGVVGSNHRIAGGSFHFSRYCSGEHVVVAAEMPLQDLNFFRPRGR